MKDTIQISIKNRCPKNFDNFKSTNKGGFCESCQNEVIDFTLMSTSEIMEQLAKNTTHGCGRFRLQQLNRPLSLSRHRQPLLRSVAIFAVSMLTLVGTSMAFAQQTKTPIATTPLYAQVSQNNKLPRLVESYTVRGTVLDDQNLPLPGVNVILKGSNTGVQTDFDGTFEFPQELTVGDILIFSYIGFDTKEYQVKASQSELIEITIQFDSTDIILMGDVVVEGVYKSKKNIFQKFIGLFK